MAIHDDFDVHSSSASKRAKRRPPTTNIDDDVSNKPRTAKPVRKTRAASEPTLKRRSRKATIANHAMLDEDSAFGGMTESVIGDAGINSGIVTSEQSEKMIVGIPMPSLAACFLFQHDVLTLGRNIMLIGLPGACKSALLTEFYRWVLLHKGQAIHCETENKDSPDLRNSLLNYDVRLMRRMIYQPADTQEDWMAAIEKWVDAAEKRFSKVIRRKKSKKKQGETADAYRTRTAPKRMDGNPGWIYPMIFGVDSLTATSSDATVQAIRDKGAPERRWPIEASKLSDWAKTLAGKMRGRPFILGSTNHLKPGQDERGMPKDNVPGGKAMRFMNSVELKMVKIGRIKTAACSGNMIKITCIKNALGQGDFSIVVALKWWWEIDANGNAVQRTVWDWDTATIDCLLAQKAVEASRWRDINEIVDLHAADGGKRTIWSKTLGIPSSSPVRYAEAGKILESRRDIVEALYPLLHIKPRTKFTPGTDYTDIQAQLQRSADRMERVYTQSDLTSVGYLDDELHLAANRSAKQRRVIVTGKDDDDDDDE